MSVRCCRSQTYLNKMCSYCCESLHQRSGHRRAEHRRLGSAYQHRGLDVEGLGAPSRLPGSATPCERSPSLHRARRRGHHGSRPERGNGSTLEAALGRAREGAGLQRSSLFATLARALPHVAPAVLTKRTMLAISRAIEDEAASRADRPVLVGSFQDARFWRASSQRWRDLAGGAGPAALLAGFRRRDETARCSRSRFGRVHPCFTSGLSSATRRPLLRVSWASNNFVRVERSTRRRVFEALWTVEPLAVREAARAGFALAVDRHPVVADALGSRLQEPVRATYDSIRTATVVTNRIIVYLERYA